MDDEPDAAVLDLGETVYDGDGNVFGTVRGFDEDGFFVTTRERIESPSVEHVRSGREFGEAELMWRRAACGEMDDLAEIPETCPSCGAGREELYYWIAD